MSSISFFPSEFTKNQDTISQLQTEFHLELYTDEHLVTETAKRFSCNEDDLWAVLQKKTSVFNQFTFQKEKVINKFRHVLAGKLQQQKGYIFFGLHSLLFPKEITEVLRVIVVGSKQDRVSIALQEGLDESTALKAIKTNDTITFRWTDFLFKKEAFDSELYDLVVPISQENGEAKIIASFFRKTPLLSTTDSANAVVKMSRDVEVERALLLKGHVVSVSCDSKDVEILVHKSCLNFSGLCKELEQIVFTVPWVHSVHIRKSQNYSDPIYRKQNFELPSKVLFVDDEKDFVQTVSTRLINRDVGTHGVYSGEDALDLINEDCPDVMVLDLKMPGMQGIEVLEKVKKSHPKIEVIILTGHGSIEEEKECMSLGAYAYLNKPVDIEKLSMRITSAHQKIHMAEA